ncbi:very short patch repair endonuclease [Azospirillum doebereinerae]
MSRRDDHGAAGVNDQKAKHIDDVRSRIMRSVKQKGTGAETAVMSAAHELGYRFCLHDRSLPGSPDLVLLDYKLAVFVHGCFWHRHAGCAKATFPKTRQDFWADKFEKNVERDARNERMLRDLGWHVATVWECETRNVEKLHERLTLAVKGCSSTFGGGS